MRIDVRDGRPELCFASRHESRNGLEICGGEQAVVRSPGSRCALGRLQFRWQLERRYGGGKRHGWRYSGREHGGRLGRTWRNCGHRR